jgi:hypothetical protein
MVSGCEKKMKKILGITMVLLLATSMVPLTLADEAEDTQQDEVKIMNDQLGAQIRLLQLEKAITKNILKGEEVVSVLKESEYDTTELEAILAELELLKEEVQSADPNSTDAVQIFVDLKSDAVELTKDFREALKELLDEKTVEELRERIREMVCEQVQNLSQQIQNRIKQFNRNQLHKIYGIIEETDSSLIDEYQNGNVTREQVKQQISKKINEMTKEKRYQVFSELKEGRIRERIQARVCVEDATEKFQERKEVRLTNRLRSAQNIDDDQIRTEMEQRMQNRLNNMGDDGNNANDNGNNGTDNNEQPGNGDN